MGAMAEAAAYLTVRCTCLRFPLAIHTGRSFHTCFLQFMHPKRCPVSYNTNNFEEHEDKAEFKTCEVPPALLFTTLEIRPGPLNDEVAEAAHSTCWVQQRQSW